MAPPTNSRVNCLSIVLALSFFIFATGTKTLKAKVTDEIYTLSLANYTGLNSESTTKEIVILGNTEVGVVINDIPVGANFLVVQVHSYIYNVSLTYLGETKSLLGTNIGFVYTVTALQLPVFYIANDNAANVTFLLAVIGYTANTPIPGGCNMEFETKVAPYLHLSSSNALVTVESQLALFKKCSVPYYVSYDFYHMYQLESDFSKASYFKAVSTMISPPDIKKNGRLVQASPFTTPMRRIFSAYHGTGSVYAVIATVYGTNISAAYIPTHTYACSMLSFSNPCVSSPLVWTVASVLLAIWGSVLNVYGHGYFKTSLFSHGFLTSSIFLYAYSGAESGPVMSMMSVDLWVLIVVGLICGRLWVWVWNQYGNPFTSTLLSAFVLTFLVFSLMLYTPYGDIVLLQSDINFCLTFLCILFLILCLFSLSPCLLNALSCSLLGSYLIILALDFFLGSNMKYVALNPIRRLSVEGFNLATLDPPVQNVDLLLFSVWAVLVAVGLVSQKLYLKGLPSYPPRYVDTPPQQDTQSLLAGDSRGYYSEGYHYEPYPVLSQGQGGYQQGQQQSYQGGYQTPPPYLSQGYQGGYQSSYEPFPQVYRT